MSIVMESIDGTTAEKQYCHAVRNMSFELIRRIEDLDDNLFGECEKIHNARKLYKKMRDQKDEEDPYVSILIRPRLP